MRRAAIAVTVAALAAFGCGGSSTPAGQAQSSTPATGSNAAQTPQQAAQTLAQSLQQAAQGMQQMQTGADGKPIELIPFEKLTALLPDVSGWDRTTPHGDEQTQFMKVSEGDAQYTKGDFHAKVTITDAALNPSLMTFFTMGLGMANERSSTGFKRSATYGGQPAMEEWDSDGKTAKVTIAVNKRFIVGVEGNGFDSFDGIKEVANAIDVSKISALK